jgi:hypothetical protein
MKFLLFLAGVFVGAGVYHTLLSFESFSAPETTTPLELKEQGRIATPP